MGRAIWARAMGMAAAAVCALSIPLSAHAQTNPPLQTDKPDPQIQAVLLGAAYAKSELSADHPMGVMFLPGRGLIRWETWGKTPAEQEEAKIEAIGLADARAVQAEIDSRAAALAGEQQKASDAMAEHERLGLMADARTVPALNLSPVTGTSRQAGGVAPLNRAAFKSQIATALGVRDGAHFKDRSRVYVFGAVSGRGVGMNLMHDEDGAWRNGGLSTDKGGFIGQRQAGLAFRRGQTQAAISYVQEKTRAQILGITAIKDHRAMLNITFTPK